MCMQCMATAMTAGAATTGIRAWVATRAPRWLTPTRLKRLTVVLMVGGVLAAGVHVGPSTQPESEGTVAEISSASAR